MQLVVRGKLAVIGREGEIIGKRPLRQNRCLVRPATGDVSDRVAAPAQHQHWQAKRVDKPDTVSVAADAQIKAAQPIATERIRAALQDNNARLECLNGRRDDRLKDIGVASVVDACSQGNIDRVILAVAGANFVNVTGSGEKSVAVFVYRKGHDAIAGVKGFLDTVSVVDVNVNVQNPREIAKQFQDRQDNVIYVAKPGSFRPFSVMETA